MKKVAITGASGMVGSRVVELLEKNIDFIPLAQPDVDITDIDSIKKALFGVEYDMMLHFAAYTNVDSAETHQKLARKINVDGTANLFNIAQDKNKPFIYISTDFVFSGTNPPYSEQSAPQPISVYGKTKYEGEKVVNKNGMIVRISYPYRARHPDKKDFVKRISALLEKGKTITMVEDSTITPTFIDDIAYSLNYLMHNFTPDIYHIVGRDSLSPFIAGLTIASVFGYSASLIQKTTYKEYYKGKAQRPQYSEIVSYKNTFWPMKTFEEGLWDIKNKLNN